MASWSHTTELSSVEHQHSCLGDLLAAAITLMSSISTPVKGGEIPTLPGIALWEVSSSTDAVMLGVTASNFHASTQRIGCSLIVKHPELDKSGNKFLLTHRRVIRCSFLSITKVIEHRNRWAVVRHTLPRAVLHWVFLVEAKQIVSQVLEEASVGAVPQQGAVPPVLQGRLVGHVPDFQVLGLDVVVAGVLVVITCGCLRRPEGVVIGPVAIPSG